jgi:GAF domain-containing protein
MKMNLYERQYNLLREAIDFFSQSLHLEQLVYYGYELVHRSLELNRSSLFIIEGDVYEMKKEMGYEKGSYFIQHDEKHDALAQYFGRIQTQDFEKYLDVRICEDFEVQLLIPIIVGATLKGFILSDGSGGSSFNESDLEFAFSINQLMNKAYETTNSYTLLEEKNYELDKRIFNLFFMHHCSRLLMAELNLENLYTLCIDVVRELTASAVTSFFLWEEHTEKFILKGYKNITIFDQVYYECALSSTKPNWSKVVFHIEDDLDDIKQLFGDISSFLCLKAEYIVLIVKENIIGVVTVSRPVNEQAYDASALEMIASVANSIYIAIANAKNYQEINRQRHQLNERVRRLEQLNKAIKNINSCSELDELLDITVSTLHYAFNAMQVAIYVKDDNTTNSGVYKLGASEGWPILEREIEAIMPVVTYDFLVDYTSKHDKDVLDQKALTRFVDRNCFVWMPVKLDLMGEAYERVLGFIVVTQMKQPLTEEDVVVIEAIAGAIAPTMRHMMTNRCYDIS